MLVYQNVSGPEAYLTTATVQELNNIVSKYLGQMVENYEVRDGRYVIRQGSAAVFIELTQMPQGTICRFTVPLLFNPRDDDLLYRRLSEYNARLLLGRLYVKDNIVFVDHALLGDHMDQPEFESALVAVAVAGDDIDDALRAEFGGQRYADM